MGDPSPRLWHIVYFTLSRSHCPMWEERVLTLEPRGEEGGRGEVVSQKQRSHPPTAGFQFNPLVTWRGLSHLHPHPGTTRTRLVPLSVRSLRYLFSVEPPRGTDSSSHWTAKKGQVPLSGFLLRDSFGATSSRLQPVPSERFGSILAALGRPRPIWGSETSASQISAFLEFIGLACVRVTVF